MDQTTELNTLFPCVEVALSKETLSLSPIKFGQIPKAVKLITPIAGVFNSLRTDDTQQNAMLLMVGDAGENIIEFLSFITKKDRVWFDDLDADDGVLLLLKVLEVNYDFFTKKVVPMVKQGTANLKSSPIGS